MTTITVTAQAGDTTAIRPLIRSDYKPGEISALCDQAISHLDARLKSLGHQPLMAFETLTAKFSDTVSPLTFMASVSPDEKIAEEAAQCEEKVGQYTSAIFTRKDLYEVLKTEDPEKLGPKKAWLLKETLEGFEDNGVQLPDDRLAALKAAKMELSKLETQFSNNLNQDKSTVEFTEPELVGVPSDFLSTLERSAEGRYIVTTSEPHYVRVMKNATLGETRRKMLLAFENKAATVNTTLLQKAIQLRQEIASILGYSTWADYRTHKRMAKSSTAVLEFLNGLKTRLATRNKSDLDKLLVLKKEMEPGAQTLSPWDIGFYSNLRKKKEFDFDQEAVREYFPTERTMGQIFKIYSDLLGVDFNQVKDAVVWSESVRLYEIRDRKKQNLIGYFYTDLYPREGKYGHAAAFPLISGRMLSSGRYHHPVAAIVANLSAPENGKPSLATHDEVETLFHEFGHIMHQTLTRAPFASLSGTNVDQDFVEAPSQIFENWAYSPEVLKMISGHYKNENEKLPDDLIRKLVQLRSFNQGVFYTRQLLFALTDMQYHTQAGAVDPTQIYLTNYKEIVGLEPLEGSHFPAGFGHLMGGYDAGYYGYLWSQVYADDLFTRFEKEGLLSPKVGAAYRKNILEPGKMKNAGDLVRKFLGREPSPEAFYKKIDS